MNEAEKDRAEPVAGEVIGRSISKVLVLLLVLPLGVLLGFRLTVCWLTGQHFDNDFGGPRVVTPAGFLMGLLMMLACPVWLASLVRRLWRRERLVLGKDRLQVLQRKGGRDVVLVQLPYGNIADIANGVADFSRFVKIDLKDLDDPNTFGDDFHHNKETTGHHYTFGDGYNVSAASLLNKLNEKIQRQHENRDAVELDQLLHKISSHGMNSLTNEEKQALQRFSKHFRVREEKTR